MSGGVESMVDDPDCAVIASGVLHGAFPECCADSGWGLDVAWRSQAGGGDRFE